MNSFTIFAFVAVVLTVAAAAPRAHSAHDHLQPVNHEQIRLKAMRAAMAKISRKSSVERRSGTTEIDLEKLRLAIDEMYINTAMAFNEAYEKGILPLLTREETKSLIYQAYEDTINDITNYYYHYVLFSSGLIDDDEIPALAEETVVNFQDSVASLVVLSEVIIQNGASEILDQVKAIDRQLVADIKTVVKPILDILRRGK